MVVGELAVLVVTPDEKLATLGQKSDTVSADLERANGGVVVGEHSSDGSGLNRSLDWLLTEWLEQSPDVYSLSTLSNGQREGVTGSNVNNAVTLEVHSSWIFVDSALLGKVQSPGIDFTVLGANNGVGSAAVNLFDDVGVLEEIDRLRSPNRFGTISEGSAAANAQSEEVALI